MQNLRTDFAPVKMEAHTRFPRTSIKDCKITLSYREVRVLFCENPGKPFFGAVQGDWQKGSGPGAVLDRPMGVLIF
jgi:hypothetical protein